MALTDLVSSQIIDAFLDVETKSQDDVLARAATDLSDNLAPGRTINIPEMSAVTINASETAAVESLTTSALTLTLDQPAVINVGIGWIDDVQGLEGRFAQQVAESCYRQMREYVFGKMINAYRDLLIGTSSADVGRVYNVGADALVDDDVNYAEAAMRRQSGVGAASDLVFLASPGANAAFKGLLNTFSPGAAGIGQGPVSTLNGIPVVITSHLGSVAGDRTAATTASTINASNVGTQTVAAGHGFIRGGLVTTSGLTANATTATAVTATTATTVACAITGSEGAQADGVGTISSASALALLVKKGWGWYAFAKGSRPEVHLIKREANAGWALQMVLYYGMRVKTGSVIALHTPAIS